MLLSGHTLSVPALLFQFQLQMKFLHLVHFLFFSLRIFSLYFLLLLVIALLLVLLLDLEQTPNYHIWP